MKRHTPKMPKNTLERETKISINTQKDTCIPIFIQVLFTIDKICKCSSTDELIKKMWHIYIQRKTTQP